MTLQGEKSTTLVSAEIAHHLFHILPYLWVMEKSKPICLKFLRDFLKDGKRLLLLDSANNFDINDYSSPVSVATLVKLILEDQAQAIIEDIKNTYDNVDLSMYSL